MSSSNIKNIDNFKGLFLNNTPMMDVRAPVEFNHGSFPNSTNLPLLNDKEREAVGTTYKNKGQDKAIELGHSLVQGDIKEARLKLWKEFAENNPEGCLFCFRGGMRSHITQEWMSDVGIDYPLITGGYKKLRRFLIDYIDQTVHKKKFTIIGGRTGVGKTIVINRLTNSVDLEGLANHRGSSFGGKIIPQPTQINFENALSIDLLKLEKNTKNNIFIEDESRSIGKCGLPLSMHKNMKLWPIILLEDSLENRIKVIKQEYVLDMMRLYKEKYGDEVFGFYSDNLLNSLARTKKRLGLELYKDINSLMKEALALEEKTGDASLHEAWIKAMLSNYYDPMYDYQLSLKKDRVVFKGNKEEILEYSNSN